MINHLEKRLLPFRAEEMLSLVADVDKYPEFLPWCSAARIRSREAGTGAHEEIFYADLVVGFKIFREKFLSKVTINSDDLVIEVEHIEGPFRLLTNRWAFLPFDQTCEVQFSVEFEFKSRILQKAMETFFNESMKKIVLAFEKRAEELYGNRK